MHVVTRFRLLWRRSLFLQIKYLGRCWKKCSASLQHTAILHTFPLPHRQLTPNSTWTAGTFLSLLLAHSLHAACSLQPSLFHRSTGRRFVSVPLPLSAVVWPAVFSSSPATATYFYTLPFRILVHPRQTHHIHTHTYTLFLSFAGYGAGILCLFSRTVLDIALSSCRLAVLSPCAVCTVHTFFTLPPTTVGLIPPLKPLPPLQSVLNIPCPSSSLQTSTHNSSLTSSFTCQICHKHPQPPPFLGHTPSWGTDRRLEITLKSPHPFHIDDTLRRTNYGMAFSS